MTVAAPSHRLSVFTRVPEPGKAKTRLTPPLTADQAAALQRAMTEDLLERLDRTLGAGASGAPSLSLEVRCDAHFSSGALEVPKGWAITSQGPGDLGERLARTAREARRDGIGRLVVIGSDAPLLPLPLVEAAFAGLADRDALLAPAEDGGYVLVGLALERAAPAAVESVFAGIPWGTGAVREATAEAARRAGLGYGELAGHWDVDRPEDLPRLAASIRAQDAGARPHRTAGVLTAAGFRAPIEPRRSRTRVHTIGSPDP